MGFVRFSEACMLWEEDLVIFVFLLSLLLCDLVMMGWACTTNQTEKHLKCFSLMDNLPHCWMKVSKLFGNGSITLSRWVCVVAWVLLSCWWWGGAAGSGGECQPVPFGNFSIPCLLAAAQAWGSWVCCPCFHADAEFGRTLHKQHCVISVCSVCQVRPVLQWASNGPLVMSFCRHVHTWMLFTDQERLPPLTWDQLNTQLRQTENKPFLTFQL